MRILNNLICACIILLLSCSAMAKDPYKAADMSWIQLSGTVVTTTPRTFELDYGKGLVTVEMDDWFWYRAGHPIIEGDEVTVFGRIDDDLFETTSIEAGSVFVKGLNTFYYANDADEEDLLYYPSNIRPNHGFQLSGTVTGVNNREFTLDTGSRKMKVDTIDMPYNPLDDKGYQKIKVGDFVQVTGKIDIQLFEKAEIMADTVTTLSKDKSKKLKR